jgi:DUF4097 and DUF4098 domain-containing protein YvlB
MQKFDRTTPVAVALRCSRGTVDITAADGVPVQVDVVPLDSSEAAAEAARTTQVALEGDTLYIQTPDASGWNWRRMPKLAITVQVPTDSSLAVKSASADVRAAGRYAVAQVDLASADAVIEEVAGDAQLKAASGDLTVGRVGGGLRINSASGDLRAGDVIGDVAADSASGDIAVRSVGGSVKASSASGDIEVGVVRRGEARLRTASGDVEVGVAAGTGVWLDVSTASGTTRNELSMTGDGTVATGGEPAATLALRIRTASGDVHIRRVTGDVPATV